MALPVKIVESFPYLQALNAPQKEAVESTQGPVLVLAGAGTGKTKALTCRLAYILESGLCYPSQTLTVTFTNKAAQEMRKRVRELVPSGAEGLWLGTFHSLAVKILRRYAEKLDFTTQFTILDTDDQQRLIKQIISAEQVDEKKYPIRMVLNTIQRWKDRALTPDKVSPTASDALLIDLYRQYQGRLKTLNAMDFGDLLLFNLKLFQDYPWILESYQNQFHYILVDEYQDTNVSQYLWLRLLAQQHQNICCVGDDDQSIYGWRGAEVGNILRFEKDFPGAKIIKLEQNYRSTPHILGAASGLIEKNKTRLGKTLWTQHNVGEKVLIKRTYDSQDEARTIGDMVENHQRKGINLSQMAVLVRAAYQTREFEERFLSLGIPYRVIGGMRFFERQEIRDAIAYLRLIHSPHDSLAFERIINTPRRGIGPTTLQHIHLHSRSENIPLPQSAKELLNIGQIKAVAKANLLMFFNQLESWQVSAQTMTPSELMKIVLDESGYTRMWQAENSPEAQGRLENLKELVKALEEYISVADFLDHVSLVMDVQEKQQDNDLITIMTLHTAKGLEFEVVFLPCWEEGLFPHQRAMDDTGQSGLEEERRLAYVGLTRARQKAIVTYATRRKTYSQGWNYTVPSRFLKDLPKEHIDVSDNPHGIRKVYSSFSGVETIDVDYEDISQDIIDVRVGGRVFHQKFGYGVIKDIEGDLWVINFDHSGLKKVISSFLTLVE